MRFDEPKDVMPCSCLSDEKTHIPSVFVCIVKVSALAICVQNKCKRISQLSLDALNIADGLPHTSMVA